MANWIDTPPIHYMLASYFGIDRKKKTEQPDEDFGVVMSQFPQDPLVLPKGDPTIGCGNKKGITQ